jgi:acyl-CoA reductase-like NAD-dependent aldehyde dehydrogenase
LNFEFYYFFGCPKQAGLPPGVLNVIHGGVDSVNFICDHPDIRAISFVGSDHAGLQRHPRKKPKQQHPKP